MTKQDLLNLIQHPEGATSTTVNQLEEILNEMPYFQAVHVLQAKISSDQNSPNKQTYIGKAAIHTADRSNLKRILEGKNKAQSTDSGNVAPIKNQVVEQVKQEVPSEKIVAPKIVVPEPTIAPEINPSSGASETSEALFKEVMINLNKLHDARKKYIFLEEQMEQTETKPIKKAQKAPLPKPKTTSKKSTPIKKEVKAIDKPIIKDEAESIPSQKIDLDVQNSLIESFIKKESEISKKQPDTEITNKQDLSEKSTIISEDLISENLAEIFIGQGKTDKAIEIYRKLIWKLPQKKSYFAARIKELSK